MRLLSLCAFLMIIYPSCWVDSHSNLLWTSAGVTALPDYKAQPAATAPEFPYGVASGDPLPDGVIIWTMLAPQDSVQALCVQWQISETADFQKNLRLGESMATADHHFRVKEDVRQLAAGTTYFYRFSLDGQQWSAVGRTRTAPAANSRSAVRLGAVSCNAYEWGHFNGFGRLAERDDLDAILHLGDYIYEYGTGEYGDTTIGRIHEPRHELIKLEDYHQRYAQYRSDPQLQAVHARHPFICIWDDHEVANNNYLEGAENHDDCTEGDYLLRLTAARSVYYDWMPVREDSSGQLYRSFQWGQVANLHMLDERLAGRTAPASSFAVSELADSSRRMLGERQFNWLTEQLQSSAGRWQLIGNQVLFADLELERVLPEYAVNIDAWDGYRYEKERLMDSLSNWPHQRLLFLTGDTHCSWHFEIKDAESTQLLAHEIGVPSLSSANFDELAGDALALWVAKKRLLHDNPHLQYTDLTRHGYLILSLTEAEAQAEFHYSKTILKADRREDTPVTITIDYDNYAR